MYPDGMAKPPSRPKDANQLAHLIAGLSVGEITEPDRDAGKDPAAVALGRRGGLRGGKAAAEAMTDEQRTERAKKAAAARWNKESES